MSIHYLVHINGLKSFSPSENYSMVLIFRFSFSYLCCTWQFYSIDFLWTGTKTVSACGTAKKKGDSAWGSKDTYLVKVINCFDQYRIVNLLYFSTFTLFHFINICHSKRRITVQQERGIKFLNKRSKTIRT